MFVGALGSMPADLAAALPLDETIDLSTPPHLVDGRIQRGARPADRTFLRDYPEALSPFALQTLIETGEYWADATLYERPYFDPDACFEILLNTGVPIPETIYECVIQAGCSMAYMQILFPSLAERFQPPPTVYALACNYVDALGLIECLWRADVQFDGNTLVQMVVELARPLQQSDLFAEIFHRMLHRSEWNVELLNVCLAAQIPLEWIGPLTSHVPIDWTTLFILRQNGGVWPGLAGQRVRLLAERSLLSRLYQTDVVHAGEGDYSDVIFESPQREELPLEVYRAAQCLPVSGLFLLELREHLTQFVDDPAVLDRDLTVQAICAARVV